MQTGYHMLCGTFLIENIRAMHSHSTSIYAKETPWRTRVLHMVKKERKEDFQEDLVLKFHLRDVKCTTSLVEKQCI